MRRLAFLLSFVPAAALAQGEDPCASSAAQVAEWRARRPQDEAARDRIQKRVAELRAGGGAALEAEQESLRVAEGYLAELPRAEARLAACRAQADERTARARPAAEQSEILATAPGLEPFLADPRPSAAATARPTAPQRARAASAPAREVPVTAAMQSKPLDAVDLEMACRRAVKGRLADPSFRGILDVAPEPETLPSGKQRLVSWVKTQGLRLTYTCLHDPKTSLVSVKLK